VAKETIWVIVFFCLGLGVMFGLKQCGAKDSRIEKSIANWYKNPDWQEREMNRSKTILR
ncbi:uncharacterized protein METZ01_LOCUS429464, partial [marine metagenome]|jgi:hypothetical protein